MSELALNEEDFTASLGIELEGLDENFSSLDPAHFKQMIETARNPGDTSMATMDEVFKLMRGGSARVSR